MKPVEHYQCYIPDGKLEQMRKLTFNLTLLNMKTLGLYCCLVKFSSFYLPCLWLSPAPPSNNYRIFRLLQWKKGGDSNLTATNHLTGLIKLILKLKSFFTVIAHYLV